MSWLTKLFGGSGTSREETSDDGLYHDGDKVKCPFCSQSLRIKYFPNTGIMVGGPDAAKGVAIRCGSCGSLTCTDCAIRAGRFLACCPKCKGPIVTFTEGIPVPRP